MDLSEEEQQIIQSALAILIDINENQLAVKLLERFREEITYQRNPWQESFNF